MPLKATDYVQQHLISASGLKKTAQNAGKTTTRGVKKGFSAVLDQVQSTCKGVSKVGKNCLTAVNPVHHVASLYRVAQAGLLPKIDADNLSQENDLLTSTVNSSSSLAQSMIDAGDLSGMSSATDNPATQLGFVSAKYESGAQGIEAIGYDRKGGTSYGTYQISSKAGTMARFIEYLQDQAPRWAERLMKSGPANTGSANGRMPREWKKIAAEDPERLEQLQYNFIKQSHYEEALAQVYEESGLNISERSAALQETLWSTAVQHGPRGAAEIVDRAIDRLSKRSGDISDEKLINEIYSSRAKYFKSSTRRIRAAVHQRFNQEKMVVLAMLKNTRDTQNV